MGVRAERKGAVREALVRLAAEGWPKTAAIDYAALLCRASYTTSRLAAVGIEFVPSEASAPYYVEGDTLLSIIERHQVGRRTAERVLVCRPVEEADVRRIGELLRWPAPRVAYARDRLEAACQPDERPMIRAA